MAAGAPGGRSAAGGDLGHDVRLAWRLFRHQPGHALASIATMALGIGATTVVFSVAFGVLSRPLPWPDADRLIRLAETRQGSTRQLPPLLTNATYLAWSDAPQTIEAIGGWREDGATLAVDGAPARIRLVAMTPSMFTVLQASPLLGSVFAPGDEMPGRQPSIVLAHGLWQDRFGGRPDVLGRLVQLDGQAHTIVGVMPRTFEYPSASAQAWVPFHVPPVIGDDPDARRLAIFAATARLRPGATPAQAAAEGTARARAATDLGLVAIAVFGSKGPAEVSAVTVLDSLTADVRPALLIMLAAVGLLLATATANVAGLQLARSTSRRREMAVRSALGAGGGRLTRQLLVENALLGLAGGLLGLALAGGVHEILPSLLPANFPRVDDIALDARVAAAALGLSLVTGVLFGLLPARAATRVDLVAQLNEDGLAPVGGAFRSSTGRARGLIMAGQMAIAFVLLAGAVLLARSFVAMLQVDRGYDPTDVLTVELPMPDASFTPARRAAILGAVLDRLRAIPRVRHAGFTSILPLTRRDALMAFRRPSASGGREGDTVQAAVRTISPGYLAALGMRVVEGRDFADTDTATSPAVVIVNRTFVRQYLDETPLGEIIPAEFTEGREGWEVAGIVDDVQQRGITEPAQPELFVCHCQMAEGVRFSEPILVVRTDGAPGALVPALRDLLREQDASLVPEAVVTMEDRVMANLARPRMYAVLLSGFSLVALVIAGVGLFGVLAFSVAQRSREIAVRVALGARRGDIVRLVLRQGLVVAGAGLVVGVVLALALVRSLRSVLYGIEPHDPLTFVVVGVTLLAVTVVACLVPARRATRIDPVRVLRGE